MLTLEHYRKALHGPCASTLGHRAAQGTSLFHFQGCSPVTYTCMHCPLACPLSRACFQATPACIVPWHAHCHVPAFRLWRAPGGFLVQEGLRRQAAADHGLRLTSGGSVRGGPYRQGEQTHVDTQLRTQHTRARHAHMRTHAPPRVCGHTDI